MSLCTNLPKIFFIKDIIDPNAYTNIVKYDYDFSIAKKLTVCDNKKMEKYKKLHQREMDDNNLTKKVFATVGLVSLLGVAGSFLIQKKMARIGSVINFGTVATFSAMHYSIARKKRADLYTPREDCKIK